MKITSKELRSELTGIILRLIETRRTVSYMQIESILRDKQIGNNLTIDDIQEYLEELERLRFFPKIYRKLISRQTSDKKIIIYTCPAHTRLESFIESLNQLLGKDVQIMGVNQNV